MLWSSPLLVSGFLFTESSCHLITCTGVCGDVESIIHSSWTRMHRLEKALLSGGPQDHLLIINIKADCVCWVTSEQAPPVPFLPHLTSLGSRHHGLPWTLKHLFDSRRVNKGPSSQSYGFFGSHVWMWELDYKESWVPKNWCFWTVVLEKTLESPLDCKEIQPVSPK